MYARIDTDAVTSSNATQPLHWALVSGTAPNSQNGPEHDSNPARCRTVAFPSRRRTWPPAGLSVETSPRASWIARFRLAGPVRRAA